jgi:formylmethanofuran dehydrogenase subunit B
MVLVDIRETMSAKAPTFFCRSAGKDFEMATALRAIVKGQPSIGARRRDGLTVETCRISPTA